MTGPSARTTEDAELVEQVVTIVLKNWDQMIGTFYGTALGEIARLLDGHGREALAQALRGELMGRWGM